MVVAKETEAQKASRKIEADKVIHGPVVEKRQVLKPSTWAAYLESHVLNAKDLGLSTIKNPTIKEVEKDIYQMEKELESMSLAELVAINKRAEEFMSKQELVKSIVAHFKPVTMAASKAKEVAVEEAQKKRPKDSTKTAGGEDVTLSEVDDVSAFTQVVPAVETADQSDCCGTSEADEGDETVDRLCCGSSCGKIRVKTVPHPFHELLPGVHSDKELRDLLGNQPLARLRNLKKLFSDADESGSLIDEISAIWKMEVFKQVELEAEARSDAFLKEQTAWFNKCLGLEAGWSKEEYSFVPGDAGHTYVNFFRSRWRNSNLRKYFGGFSASLELTNEEVDTTVGALIIMDALILTIPFGLIPNLGTSFWNNLEDEFHKCPHFPPGWNADRWFHGWYSKLTTWITVSVYVVTAAMVLSCLYYTNRPTDDRKFRTWWVTGKFCFYFIQLLSIISVIMLLSILSCLQVLVMSPSEYFCDSVNLVYHFNPVSFAARLLSLR